MKMNFLRVRGGWNDQLLEIGSIRGSERLELVIPIRAIDSLKPGFADHLSLLGCYGEHCFQAEEVWLPWAIPPHRDALSLSIGWNYVTYEELASLLLLYT